MPVVTMPSVVALALVLALTAIVIVVAEVAVGQMTLAPLGAVLPLLALARLL